MDGMLPPVVVSLVANIKQFQASMATARGELTALETQGVSSFAKFQKMSLIAGAGAAAAIVGGVALAVKAYQEDELAQARLQQALKNTHQSYAALEPQLKATAESMAKFGFEDNQATDALATLVTATGNATKAQQLLSVAVDLAAYKNMSLESATTLVAKASNGSATALTRMGINIGDLGDKGKTAAEKLEYGNKVIAALTAQIGGQAEAKAKTFAGTMAALTATMGNFASNIGEAVMPYVQILADGLKNVADWIMANEAAVKVFIGIVAGVLVVVIANATVILLAYAAAWVAANFQILLVVGSLALLIAAFKSGNPVVIAATIAVGALAAAMIYANRQIILLQAQMTIYTAKLAVMRAATMAATAAQTALGIASWAALGPLGLIVGALALVAGGFYLVNRATEESATKISQVNKKTGEITPGLNAARQASGLAARSMRLHGDAAVKAADDINVATYAIKNHTAAALIDADATWSAADAYSGYAAAQQRTQSSIKGSEQLYAGYVRVVKEGNKWKQEQKDKHDKAGGAAAAEKEKIVELDKAMKNVLNSTIRWAKGTTDLGKALGGDAILAFSKKVLAAKKITQETVQELESLASTIKTNISNAIQQANDKLDAAIEKFNGYRDSIAGGIMQGNTLADAAKNQSDAIKAVAEALKGQADAQAALNEARKGDDEKKIADAQKAYEDATGTLTVAQDRQKSFLDFLQVGADTAKAFGKQIDQLRLAGASLEVTQQIAEMGAETGGRIAAELLSGASAAIDRANELTRTVQKAAQDAGDAAAKQFFQSGIDTAQAFMDAINSQIPSIQAQLNSIADMIAEKLKVQANVAVGPETQKNYTAPAAAAAARPATYTSGGRTFLQNAMGLTIEVPARAAGGPVLPNRPYMVGENGPELMVPKTAGTIVPNGQGNTINVYAQTNANATDIAREMAWQLKVGVS